MKLVKLIGGLLALGALTLSLNVLAESTVVTSKGTFRCDSACVVADDGSVTDSEGGNVWKLQEHADSI